MVDKNKYWAAVFFVFVFGTVSQLAIDQLVEHWSQVNNTHDFLAQIWSLRANLKVDLTGLVKIWQFVASGVGLAGIFCWLFEKWIWKISWLQGWFVLLPYIQGTWMGVLVPRTRSMQVATSSAGTSSWWREEKVLPVHVTIIHTFDRIIYTAQHPNSTNTTWATDLNHNEASDEIHLYVVYHNTPKDPDETNAAEHDGCLKVKLEKPSEERSATAEWQFTGKYWTDKARRDTATPESEQIDRGSWGRVTLRWKSREMLPKPNWDKRETFISQ